MFNILQKIISCNNNIISFSFLFSKRRDSGEDQEGNNTEEKGELGSKQANFELAERAVKNVEHSGALSIYRTGDCLSC